MKTKTTAATIRAMNADDRAWILALVNKKGVTWEAAASYVQEARQLRKEWDTRL